MAALVTNPSGPLVSSSKRYSATAAGSSPPMTAAHSSWRASTAGVRPKVSRARASERARRVQEVRRASSVPYAQKS